MTETEVDQNNFLDCHISPKLQISKYLTLNTIGEFCICGLGEVIWTSLTFRGAFQLSGWSFFYVFISHFVVFIGCL